MRSRIDWKYLLRMEPTDIGFDHSVLSEFKGRLLAGNLGHLLLDKLLERCAQLGLVKGGSKQRTDSTRILGAIRDLNRLEVVGESVRAALSDYGVSGAKAERPGLDKALDQIRKGDILVIWKLDRLGRSLSHLLSIIEDLKQKV